MKIIAPSYYPHFKCIAQNCRHTCCVGWEIDVDEESLPRFLADQTVAPYIDTEEPAHIRLLEGERCPFLEECGLCRMILEKGEDSLCQICRDHPRFRNYWSDREELGLGLVCEAAASLVLGQNQPLTLITLSDDGKKENLPFEEQWLLDLRAQMIGKSAEIEPPMLARLWEYLCYRHLPNALYDGLVEERIRFIEESFAELSASFEKSDGSLAAFVEILRVWSYDVEYDDGVIDTKLTAFAKEAEGKG